MTTLTMPDVADSKRGRHRLFVEATFAVMVYDPPSNTWTTRSGIPHLNTGGVAGVIDGKIYVTTGTDGSAYRNLLDVYDPATDAWTSLAGSSVPHQRPAGGVTQWEAIRSGRCRRKW